MLLRLDLSDQQTPAQQVLLRKATKPLQHIRTYLERPNRRAGTSSGDTGFQQVMLQVVTSLNYRES